MPGGNKSSYVGHVLYYVKIIKAVFYTWFFAFKKWKFLFYLKYSES